MKWIALLTTICFLFIPTSPVGKAIEQNIITPTQIYTYEKMTKDLHSLKRKYKDALFIASIGESPFGKEIWAIKLGKGEDHILMTASHHGREWLTTNLLLNMMEEYTKAYTVNKNLFGYKTDILDKISIWFIPMVNPDGVEIQQKGIKQYPFAYQQILADMNYGSDNFKRWKANGLGIDLNRQYPAGWDAISGDSPSASYQFYKGEYPLQASEVESLVKFTYKITPLMVLSYHSSGRELYWHYKTKQAYVMRDFNLAKSYAEMSGYKLSQPPKHATGGGYTDWFIQEFKKPAITIEISKEVKETNPPLTSYNEEWLRNREAGLMIIHHLLQRDKRKANFGIFNDMER